MFQENSLFFFGRFLIEVVHRLPHLGRCGEQDERGMREESGQSMGDQANELGGGLVTERGEGRLWETNDQVGPVR